MGSKVGKLLGTALPLAAAFIPGIGPLAAAGLGAAGGALGGGGLKGALLGGVTGGLGGGLGSSIGGSVLGQSASSLGSRLIGGGLTGAAGGLLSGGGLKSALLGAGLGAAGSGLSSSLGIGGGSSGGGSLSNLFGGGSGGSYGPATVGQVAQAGGTNEALKGLSGGGSGGLLSGVGSGGLSSYAKTASDIYGGIQGSNAQDDIKKQLLAAQGKSAAALAPYTASGLAANSKLSDSLAGGFDSSHLADDPGYQFQLQQGTEGLNRSLGAKGNLFSGAALKAASDYTSGLANSTYDQAYNRWLQGNNQLAGQSAQGLGATGALNQVYDNQGNINANATLGKSNILNQTLSSLFGGNGATYGVNGTVNPNIYGGLTAEQKRLLGVV